MSQLPWMSKLRDYQQEGALWLQTPPPGARGRLLPWSPGLGKTRAAIAAVRLRFEQGKLDSCVPVVTTAISRSDWAREIKATWPEAKVHVMRVDDVEAHHRWESDEDFVARRQLTWRAALKSGGGTPTFLIASYEAARDLHEVACEDNLLFDTIVFDEAHAMKYERTLTSTLLRVVVAKARLCILLTGTPVHNRPKDLFNLLSIMDPSKFSSFMKWARQFFLIRGTEGGYGWVVSELLDKDGLRDACAPYMMDVPVERALGALPPHQRYLRRIPVKEAVRMSPAKLRKMRTGSGLDKALRAMTRYKQKYAIQLIQDLDEPIVAYTYGRDDAKALHDKLMGNGVKCTLAIGSGTEGGSTPEKRARLIEGWKAGASRVLVATMDAVKESATLTRAACTIFLDIDWLPGKMIQLEGRTSPTRQVEGERRPARYYYLVVENGPDEVVAESVIQKITETQGIVSTSANTEGLKEMLRPLKREAEKLTPEQMLAELVSRLELRTERMNDLGLGEDFQLG